MTCLNLVVLALYSWARPVALRMLRERQAGSPDSELSSASHSLARHSRADTASRSGPSPVTSFAASPTLPTAAEPLTGPLVALFGA